MTLATKSSHAIVIGAGMAGLLAARALTDHFGHVTIVERDTLPDSIEFRDGIPQARHVHALLARGQNIIEDFFPGLKQELTDHGAPRIDWGHDVRTFLSGRWQHPYQGALVTNIVTRTSLEWHVRQRVAQIPNITFITRTEIDGLLTDPTCATVTGVQLRSRVDRARRDLSGDLIVDASGRRSQAPEWFTSLGYDAPDETLVNAFIGYATRWYEAKPDHEEWKAIVVSAEAGRGPLRSGGLFQVEGNQWLVTMVGMNKDYPPTDEAGFMAYIKSLPTPAIYHAIQNAKPISPIYGYRYEGSRRRHYEKLKRQPENFILIGDAVCSFNPAYGQGMTVAAIEAQTLSHLLARHGTATLSGFAAKFQQAMIPASADAWLLATGEDLRFPATEGKRPGAAIRLIQRYTDKVLEGASVDPYLARRFNRVMHMVDRPTTFFHPQTILHVLRFMQTQRRRTASSASA